MRKSEAETLEALQTLLNQAYAHYLDAVRYGRNTTHSKEFYDKIAEEINQRIGETNE